MTKAWPGRTAAFWALPDESGADSAQVSSLSSTGQSVCPHSVR